MRRSGRAAKRTRRVPARLEPARGLMTSSRVAVEPATEEALTATLRPYGDFDYGYLQRHYARYADTYRRYHAGRGPACGGRLLDVGAHWLHQSTMWARAGYSVTALDLPATLACDHVRRLAADQSIQLISEPDLEHCASLADEPSDSYDVVLFTEVLEHITFNPVALWSSLYRVLRPGGRIVVTTPNYYALRGRLWSPLRFLSGSGGGLTVEKVLSIPTYGPHWKEYSMRELVRYFSLLSPDFRVDRANRVQAFSTGKSRRPLAGLGRLAEQMAPALRPNLYLEVGLTEKRHGITTRVAW